MAATRKPVGGYLFGKVFGQRTMIRPFLVYLHGRPIPVWTVEITETPKRLDNAGQKMTVVGIAGLSFLRQSGKL